MLARIRKAKEENEGGFTLIELLVVIIIIGILAAIAIPVFLNQRQKGYDSQAKSDARNAATAEETVLTDTNAYSAAILSSGFKGSPNVTTSIAVDAGKSYCIVTGNTNSKNAFLYNSATGGLSAAVPGADSAAAIAAAKALCTTIASPTWAAPS
jgi:type IV pilus assembly protein PilA